MTALDITLAAYLAGAALTRLWIWSRERAFHPAHRDPVFAAGMSAAWPLFWLLIVLTWMEEPDRG